MLAALVRALHLNNDHRDHLFELAGRQAARPRRQAAQKVQPQLRRLLDDLAATPSVVIGRRMDILTWNPLAAVLLTDFAKVPEMERNYVRILFSDPAMRTLYADWRTVARECVSHLRMMATTYPDDPRLTGLVGELSVHDTDFGRWWRSRHVASRSMGREKFHHPVAGELVLDRDALACGTDPDQEIVVWTAEPDTPSHEGLRVLASWTSLSR